MDFRISIYTHVLLPFALATVVVVFCAWWAATSVLTSALEQRLNLQLSHATDVLAKGAFPFTADLLSRVADLQNAEFALLRDDGSVGLSSLDASQGDLIGLIESAHQGEKPVGYDLVFHPLQDGRHQEYVEIVGLASLADVRSAARRTALSLGALALGATLLMAIVGHRISRSIALPLQNLGEMAQKIARGDRNIRAEGGTIREINALNLALNDMTARLAAYEEELITRNRLANLGEVAARVAHEIRNPLTAMKLQVQLLQERLSGTGEVAMTQRLLSEMDRLELVVASTLTLGRPAHVDRKPGHLNEMVADVVGLVAPQFEHRGIQLHTSLGELPVVPLDVDKLKQVVFNLLTNAADALPGGGDIRIETSQTASQVLLVIEDSGPGLGQVPEEVFAARGASPKAKGLGVGLAISRELVALHDGTLTADHGPNLGGARFTIALPKVVVP